MVRTITKEELKEKMDSGEKFVLVDARDTPDYEKEHIIGSVHLLISEMENKVKSMLKKDDLIITYSEDFNCPASTIAAEKLINYGFINVLVYKGGWKDWKDAKYPVEKK